MKYVLNKSLMVFETKEHEIFISVPGLEIMTIESKVDEVLSIFNSFVTPRSYEEAYSVSCQKEYILKNDFLECFEFMRKNNILKKYYDIGIEDDYIAEKYKRQVQSFNSLPNCEIGDAWKIQNRLANSHICIIGVGGTGSYLSLALSCMGINKLTILDHDSVELSNTSRQILYSENDIGRLKIDVAKEKLKTYNSRITINTICKLIENAKDLESIKDTNIDLLICCADTPRGKIQYAVDDFCSKYKIPWFCYGPYNHSQIHIGPIYDINQNRTYTSTNPKDTILHSSPRIKNINKNFIASICDAYNGLASQVASIEVLKYLTNKSKSSIMNKRYIINTDTWNVSCDACE